MSTGNRISVDPSGVPAPKGGLSQGLIANGFLFTSGKVAFHPETGEIVGTTVREQTVQTLRTLERILAAAALDLSDVVQCTVHLADVRRDFQEFDATYRTFFSDPMPTRTTVGSVLAVEGLLVEIDLIAALRKDVRPG